MKQIFTKAYFILLLSLFFASKANAIHTIFSFSPVSAYPRAVVTIIGSNFYPLSGNVHVFFGAAKAQVIAVYNDSLKVRVPFGATVAPITISVNGFTVSTLNHFVPSYPASTATPTNLNFFPTEGNLNLTYNGQSLKSYASADIDNDGKLDLISVVNFDPSSSAGSANSPYINRLRIFRNIAGNGGGIANSIIDPVYLDLVGDSTIYSYKYGVLFGFKTADINSDGFIDIVARMDSGIVFFINKGTAFSHTMFNRILIQHPLLDSKPYLSSSEQIFLADFDGNGKVDIIVATPNSLNVISNNSNGISINSANFSINRIRTFQQYRTGSVYVGKITDDNKPDILIHEFGGLNNDTLYFIQNTYGVSSSLLDSNAFTSPTIVSLILNPITSQICDLNNDGNMDISTIYFSYNGFLNNMSSSSFSFSPITSIFQGSPLYSMPLGDLTGDGIVDVVTAWGGGIIVRRNDNTSANPLNASAFTSATFTKPTYGLQETANTLFDLDNDGRPDLVTTRQVSTTTTNANLLISRNTYSLRVPTVNVSSASYTNITSTSIKITINTPGNGTGRAILMKAGTVAISSFPANYTYYAATQVYGTSPSLGDGSKVVYVGDTNVITITGLNPATSYKIAIVEMNGWANATTFLTTGAYTTTGTTLPVTWLSFEGKKVKEGVLLNWQTASEKNNNYFEVERSFNLEHWQTLGKVKGHGTSSTTSKYNYTDKDGRLTANDKDFPVVYYRLKQIDIDGSFDYSSAISIDLYNEPQQEEVLNVNVFPVPFNNEFAIQTNAQDGFDYAIIDSQGLEVLKGSTQGKEIKIDATHLSNGIYIILIHSHSTQEIKSIKVIKGE